MATTAAHRRDGIDACSRYLTNNLEYLRHDQALEAGWPIATGVIEGARRHLIADSSTSPGTLGPGRSRSRPETPRSGHQRCLDEYWRFHLARQHERVHRNDYQDGYSLTA
ncbi:hypothetical protein E1295_42890 [Nonomuraea mesophila]|uniref:Uncharacterized protein n=1 Tax=Nonomuraea mesophila TaxID=2530382 RepID=A0A4R5E8R2_9ACTN|nr:hypothetical protein [Nonomuraea mesophila]TDE27837.1 hypothetical protein E1295_42890 [Nonomuraea mesophila]